MKMNLKKCIKIMATILLCPLIICAMFAAVVIEPRFGSGATMTQYGLALIIKIVSLCMAGVMTAMIKYMWPQASTA